LLALVPPSSPARAGSPAPAHDALAAEIARWSAYLKDNPSTDEMWTQVKDATTPVMERTEQALRDGRRLLALQRFAAARVDLAAFEYLETRPPGQRKDTAGFEAEWARFGTAMRKDLGPPSAAALAGVTPAAVRAIGEAALPQVRAYYEASLEYGRNTMPDEGLFYLGSAQAQKELASLCRSLTAKTRGRPPRLRPLQGDIDRLERDLLAVYRPPVSIDRHAEFIAASSTLNEARALDEAGLRHGALLKYLDAARLAVPLRAAQPPPDAAAIAGRLREFDDRMTRENVDHSIGRMFLESAQANLDAPAADAGPAIAAAIVSDVMPRYFIALAPPLPEPPRPEPRVTVTLVRWPYT
jgi:hypothetical protein